MKPLQNKFRFSNNLVDWLVVLKMLHIILLASVKYIVTLPYALLIGLEYKYAIVAVLVGGIGGFLFFYYLSGKLVVVFFRVWPSLCKWVPKKIKKRYQLFCAHRSQKRIRKVFSKKSRFLIRTKNTYGFWGVIIATPVILTIPIGAFLANRYYRHYKRTVLYMVISIVVWGGVLSALVHLFPNVFL